MVIVLVDSLVKEPPVSIISSEPFSIVSVPVVSVNGISSVTITFPSMIISSEPVGSTSLLQFDASDQTPVAPPSQTPFATGIKETVSISALRPLSGPSSHHLGIPRQLNLMMQLEEYQSVTNQLDLRH